MAGALKVSLRVALTLLLTAMIALPLVGVQALVRSGIEARFKEYLDRHLSEVHQRLMDRLERSSVSGTLDPQQARLVGEEALTQGLLVSILDPQGTVLWEPRTDRSDAIVQTLNDNQADRFPGLQGSMVEARHPLKVRGVLLGTMSTAVHVPWNLAPDDANFLKQLDTMFWGTELAGILVALVLGLSLARTLSRPLDQLSQIARSLGQDPIPPSSTVHFTPFREMFNLQQAILQMRSSLQDLKKARQFRVEVTAHELRTPLANLSSQLEALEDGVLRPGAERFRILRAEVERLQTLVEDWEILEQVRAGDLGVQIRPVHLQGLVTRVATLFSPRFLASEQRWTQEVANLTLNTDEGKLEQVLTNLMENAHRHGGPGIAIELRAQSEGATAVVEVRDTGPGIPREELPLLFDRFYRGEPSRSRKTGGAGLGLSVAKALTETLGGTLEISSTLGKGTVCTLRFPTA